MFSHANLAIFTKNGTLLPLNTKAEIIISINDDYDGQAVFYPITGEDETGVYFRDCQKVYGGRFSERLHERRAAIIHNGKVDYVNAEFTDDDYEEINVSPESEVTLYTLKNITLENWAEGTYDSNLVFPNIMLSQKLIFNKVSTELFETEFLFVMAEVTDEFGNKTYKKISSLLAEDTDNTYSDLRDWVERYKLLFFIDCRNQQDFRIFTVTGDEAIWSDRAELDLIDNSVIISNGTEADYPMGIIDPSTDLISSSVSPTRSPRIDIGFSGENEGVYEQTLHICLLDKQFIDEDGIPIITPIGEIKMIAETEGEDERYRTLFTNFGIPDPKIYDYVYKDSYADDEKPDFISINKHSKEMFLEYDKIFPYVGTYRALINAVHLLGYDDIFFKEWYKVLDVSDEIPRGYVAYDMSYQNSGHNNTLAALPLEKRIHLRKKNWLSMLYSLNREIYGAPDEYDFPYVEELFEYRTEDMLLKLIALREWLEKYVMALNCRIIDIGGEGIYFERYGIHGYGGATQNLEHEAGLNLIPEVADSSLSETRVLIDSSAIITVKANAKFEERRFEDLLNLRFEDFCNGVITDDNIYHTYDGSTEGRYTGTLITGYNDRYTGKLTAVSTVKDYIFGEDGFISEDSPRIMISDNEISFIPEDIVYKEKNTAFLRMPVIALERAVLRSFSDTWEKPIKYLIYPENNLETGVSYFIENKITKDKVGSFDYVYLVPPVTEETDDSVTIIPRNNPNNVSAEHAKRKHYNYTSDFGGIVKEYTTDDTTYGFRFSANNAYEIPLISIQGYSVKRPVQFEFPVNQEYYLDILKGKLIFDDFGHCRRIYVIFDTDENGERSIDVKISYFGNEFTLCKYSDGNYVFDHFIEGEDYTDFLALYDEDTENAVDYNLYKDIKVYNSGEFKVNLTVHDIYGEVYSADAYNTAKVLTLQPLINTYTNEPVSNNEYNREGHIADASSISALYDKFCYFWYKTKYPVLEAKPLDLFNSIKYPIYPYSGDIPETGMTAHYSNLSDKFKVVAYDKFITHDDRIDWNYYLILNRQNRHANTRIVEKNDKGTLQELYTGRIDTYTVNMAQRCCELFDDAERIPRENGPEIKTDFRSENLDVTVMFYNEVGAFPVMQVPGKMLNAKALDNLQKSGSTQEYIGTPYGYYDDEYHLLLSHDITNCYTYVPGNSMGRITSIMDASGNISTGLSFIQDGVEWLVKTVFSEGYGSLWEYDYIPTQITSETIIGKRYAYADVDSGAIDAVEGYYYTPSDAIPEVSTGIWNPVEFEDLPWVSGWLTYKGNPVLSKTFIDLDTGTPYDIDYRIPAGMVDSSLRYRVPSFDAKFGDNSEFSPYYAIKPRTLMDKIPDFLEDPNISVYIYPYWQTEIRIIGFLDNRVYVQFENEKYKFPHTFKPGEMVKLIWRTGTVTDPSGNIISTEDASNCIGQASYKVIGYDNLGFVLILEGEINKSFAAIPGKKYAYATIDPDIYEESGTYYDISTKNWNPKEYEDMPSGWVTGWLSINGNIDFTYQYIPEKSYYYDHPELYYIYDETHYGPGIAHTHTYRIPAGKHIDPSTHRASIMYRVISHDDLKCAWPLDFGDPNSGSGIDPNGMFFPYFYIFNGTVDASLFISYAHNVFSDYKLPVTDSDASQGKVEVRHPTSVVNDKLTYYVDDTFKATYRTFDVDNGILFWMNSSDGKPLICNDNIYSYNCPVTTYEKTPYTAFNIDYKDVSNNGRETVLWRVYKSVDAKEKTLLFESWNKALFLDITEKGVYDIEVNEFDKYGNRAVHMYEGAYRILPSEIENVTVYNIDVTTELIDIEGENNYGYVTGGGLYEEGTLCVLKAVAYDGFEFLGWSISDTLIETNSMLMFVVSRSSEIKAKFRAKPFIVNIASNDEMKGTIALYPEGTQIDSGIYEYPYGTECIAIATPNYYQDVSVLYNFIRWDYNDTAVSNSLEYRFVLSENCSIKGIFDDKRFNILAKSNNTEYGTASSSASSCIAGESCLFTATLNSSDNYEFIGWYEDGSTVMASSSMTYTIPSVTRDYNMIAKFKVKDVPNCSLTLIMYPSNVSDDYNLKINGNVYNSTISDSYGTVKVLSAALKPNISNSPYAFNGWYNGNTLLSNSSTYNYTLQVASATVTAKFNTTKYTVISDIKADFGIVTPAVTNVTHGDSVELNVSCTALYELDINNSTVDGFYGEIKSEQLPGDPYNYKVTITEVTSELVVNFTCLLRHDYEPFYIIGIGDNIRIDVNALPATNVYYNCMVEGSQETVILDPNNPKTAPAGKKVYIWAQQSRTVATNGLNPGFEISKAGSSQKLPYTVGGNLISLITPRKAGSSYINYSTWPLTDSNQYCFKRLFANSYVIDAAELIVAPNTVKGCYYEMFCDDSSLSKSPELRATEIAISAYVKLYAGCTSLKEIKTKHTSWNIPGGVSTIDKDSLPTYKWVENVSSISDNVFKKVYGLPTMFGENFIPMNWNVEVEDN